MRPQRILRCVVLSLSFLSILSACSTTTGTSSTTASKDSTSESSLPSSPSQGASSSLSSETSTLDSSTTSFVDTSSFPFDPTEKTWEEILSDIERAKSQENKGMTFEDSFTSTHGTVSFYENEILEQTYEGESEESVLLYRAREDGYYYEIDTGNRRSSRKKIVEEDDDSSASIPSAEVEEKLSGINHSLSSFLEKAQTTYEDNHLVLESLNHSIAAHEEDYDVTITSGSASGHSYQTELTFDEEGKILKGEFVDTTWSSDNFDKEEGKPIDPSLDPKERKTLKVTFDVRSKPTGQPKFDRTPYFITALDEVFLSNSSGKKNQLEIGDYVDISIESFSPETALDSDSYGIIAVEDESIIGKVSDFTNSYKALKEGTTTVTVGDPLGLVSKEIEVTVTVPLPTGVWIDYGAKDELEVDETLDISYEVLPEAASQEVKAVSSDENVLKVVSVDPASQIVKVQGIAEGESTLTLTSTADESKKDDLRITVHAKKAQGDASVLLGTWTATDDEFETTITFYEDFTGEVEQKVQSIAVPNSATFTYEFSDNTLVFPTWETDDEETILEPTKASYDPDSGVLTIVACCMDADEFYVNLTMELTKESTPLSFLLGKWNGVDEYDSNPVNLSFEEGGKGTVEAGYNYTRKGTFTYTYVDGILSFPTWDFDYYYGVDEVELSADKTTITLQLEDDYGYYDYVFTKVND